MIRKHSAKCVRMNFDNDIHHYVEVGGKYYYNGRTGFSVVIAEPDGFWKQSIATIIASNADCGNLKELARYARYFGGKLAVRHYIRHWETNNA